MTALQEAERLLTTMTPAEKAQILQWIVKDIGNAFPGIESHYAMYSQFACGEIDLRYVDQSGFCVLPYLLYAWQERGKALC